MKIQLIFRVFLLGFLISESLCDESRGSNIIRRRKKIKKPQVKETELSSSPETTTQSAVETTTKFTLTLAVPKLEKLPAIDKLLKKDKISLALRERPRRKKPTRSPIIKTNDDSANIKFISFEEETKEPGIEIAASDTIVEKVEDAIAVTTQPSVKPIKVVAPETRAPLKVEKKDRVVTEQMQFRVGVPVDYSYNETSDNPGDIISVPGCPKSIDGYPWVLYGSPKPLCYLVGLRSSVCQGSAVMHYKLGSEYGVCACNFQECLIKSGLSVQPVDQEPQGNKLRKRNGVPGKLRYRFCRPYGIDCEEYVYDYKEKRCDILYSQGSCQNGEWIQRNSKGGVECAPRLCKEGAGLNAKSELFNRSYGNITEENAQCCKPSGGIAIGGIIPSLIKSPCGVGEVWSETLKRCISKLKNTTLLVG